MVVYYNEFDPYAAQWLRYLIAFGQLPSGVVDERDIRDVKPGELEQYDQCHLFAGIGGWPLALKLAGWPDDRPVWTGSCPCQPFSAAGQRKGTADERHLWPEFFRLIAECRPPVVFGEQVASAEGRLWLGGREGLQRVQDREAIIGVLQSENVLGRLPDALQILRLLRRDSQEEKGSEGQTVRRFQKMAEAEPRGSIGPAGAPSREIERAALHGRSEGSSGDHRCRGMPDDRNPVQLGRRSDVGQPFAGSDRQCERLHARERQSGAVLHQCDGEYVGREQDRGDIRSDHAASPQPVGRIAGEAGIRIEAASEFSELAGVRADLEGVAYAVGAADLCAAGVRAPHIRQRLYWLADSDGGNASTERLQRSRQHGQQPQDGQDIEGVGDATSEPVCRRGQPWEPAIAIECDDGFRRVGPGTLAVAHGVPARVGKLRAYGNAIVPQVAAEFVRAYLEASSIK